MDHTTTQPARSARFAVFGHANLEVTAAVGGFPLTYAPDRTLTGGISLGVAGTAYNVGIALWRLGNQVDLCVTLGADPAAAFVTASLPTHSRLRIIPAPVPEQPVTVVLTGPAGQRMILLDHRAAATHRHQPATAQPAIDTADLVVLPVGPVNADLADHLAARDRTHGPAVACDVHAITGLDGPHEAFCAAADILFMSDERLPHPPDDWLPAVLNRWPVRLVVLGQGAHGATSPSATNRTPTTCRQHRPSGSPAPSAPATPCAPPSSTATAAAYHPNSPSTAPPSSPPPNSPPPAAPPATSPPTNSTPG
jgi:sugar/nucleoside kinase (ribokinase family)